MTMRYQPTEFFEIPGWLCDDFTESFSTFVQTATHYLEISTYNSKRFDIDQDAFFDACRVAVELSKQKNLTETDIRQYFENQFSPVKVSENGFVTGYFEPEIEVSFDPNDRFRYPFYKRPNDLVDIKDPSDPPQGVEAGYAYAQKDGDSYQHYPDRKQIDQGFLKGKGLELAYAANKMDVYFTHIQGSAKLSDQSGQTMRITYAAKSGHPYTSIGKILIEMGEISQSDMSMTAISNWIESNPERSDDLLWHNRSYIFFEELTEQNDKLGPKGAAKVQLTAGRSLAVDKSIYPFGLPVFVASPTLNILDGNIRDDNVPGESSGFARLMIAQDTGSAIIGPARGDIYVGSGQKAGARAGQIAHDASFFILMPKQKAN